MVLVNKCAYYYLGIEFLGNKVFMCLVLIDMANQFYPMVATVYFPTSNGVGLQLTNSQSTTSIQIVSLFILAFGSVRAFTGISFYSKFAFFHILGLLEKNFCKLFHFLLIFLLNFLSSSDLKDFFIYPEYESFISYNQSSPTHGLYSSSLTGVF